MSKVAHTMKLVKPLSNPPLPNLAIQNGSHHHPMQTSISRFVTISCRAFVILAVFAISAVALAHPVRAQSQQSQPPPSQDDKSGGSKQAQPSEDQTPSSQTGSNVPEKAPVDPKAKKDKKSDDPPEAKLHIVVTSADAGKGIGGASVYIRYAEGKTFFTRKEKQAEENFKTNQDGSVKVPSVPRGKVLIQVIAPGWHTYGKWYDIDKDEVEIQIKLEKPPRWY